MSKAVVVEVKTPVSIEECTKAVQKSERYTTLCLFTLIPRRWIKHSGEDLSAPRRCRYEVYQWASRLREKIVVSIKAEVDYAESSGLGVPVSYSPR